MKTWFNRVGRVLRRRERPPKGREQGNDWRLTFKRRVLVVTAVLGVWVFFIQLRLAWVQVIQHADYEARAEQQHNRTRDVPAKRGDIVDRKGHLLATSVDADTVYAVPSEIGDPDVAVAKLCTAFRDCTSKERQSLTERLRRRGAFAYVRRQVSHGVRHPCRHRESPQQPRI